jgi:exodeoxyribonuclease VII large subunit
MASLERRLRQALLLRSMREQVALQMLAGRLRRAARVATQRSAARLESTAARMQSLDPKQVLQRGYAWVEDAAGRPVVSTLGLRPGQQVQAVWADGRARAELLDVHPTPPPAD